MSGVTEHEGVVTGYYNKSLTAQAPIPDSFDLPFIRIVFGVDGRRTGGIEHNHYCTRVGVEYRGVNWNSCHSGIS